MTCFNFFFLRLLAIINFRNKGFQFYSVYRVPHDLIMHIVPYLTMTRTIPRTNYITIFPISKLIIFNSDFEVHSFVLISGSVKIYPFAILASFYKIIVVILLF